MLKKMSIRMRLTILSVLLLSICCVGLTAILNISANRMVDVIEATPILPSMEAGEMPLTDAARTNPAKISSIPSENSQLARQNFRHQSVLYMIVIVMAGGGLTYVISGRALKPLQALSCQIKNRTVHNLSEDLKMPPTKDEIADLTSAFNEMSHKLDNAFSMQKRFSQSAAHELRTPLAVLKTKVDVFKKKSSHTPEEYDRLLTVISTHTDRLSNLVQDLLDLTSTDALVYDETIALKHLLLEIIEELSLLTERNKVTLVLHGAEQTVLGNKSLLRRAFYNLIENAIKYNQEDGNVYITLATQEGNTVVTISDTGIGIPQEMRELIFEPFFRVDKSRSRQMGGAGIGLSIVKSIIDQHHGEITVTKSECGGSIFKVTL